MATIWTFNNLVIRKFYYSGKEPKFVIIILFVKCIFPVRKCIKFFTAIGAFRAHVLDSGIIFAVGVGLKPALCDIALIFL